MTHFILFSFMACPPNYLWQSWLEAQFPGYTQSLSPAEKEEFVDDIVTGRSTTIESYGTMRKRGPDTHEAKSSTDSPRSQAKKKLNLRNTGIKFALDQTVGAAINTIMFLAGIGLLRGKSTGDVYLDVAEQFWPLIAAGQKLWPAVSIISFTLVPVERRTLFGSLAGMVWNIFLTLASGGKRKH